MYLIGMGTARVEIGRWDEAPRREAGDSAEVKGLEALAWMLDAAIPVPGTRLRVGLDAVLGLIPVVGDLAGMLLSGFILVHAARQGIPRVTLMRMGFNVALEAAVGIIPIAGDAFDIYWQANRRNIELLKAHLRDPRRARRGDWLFASLFLAGAAALLIGLAWGGLALGRAIAGLWAG